MSTPQMSLEELFDIVISEECGPSYEALLRWCERYPEFRNELTEFFATWGVQETMSQHAEIDEDRLANIGVSHALNLLEARNERQTQESRRPAHGERLLRWAGRIGVSEEALMSQSRLDRTLLKKLDLRRLTGVPQQCIEFLASALQSSVEFLRPLITGPPLAQQAVRYKSRERPKLVTEDFADAVRSSSLEEADKCFWIEVISKERP